MATWLNPYIGFGGNAREAMEFYQTVFGGKLDLMTGAQFGLPEDQAERIMHAHLVTDDGWSFMAADSSEQVDMTVAPITLCIGGEGVDRAQKIYEDLLAGGGQAVMPLAKQQWGSIHGHVRDQFGVLWMLDFSE